MNKKVFIGCDIGASSIKVAVIGPYSVLKQAAPFLRPMNVSTFADGEALLLAPYRPLVGHPREATRTLLEETLAALPASTDYNLAFTGAGAPLAAKTLAGRQVSDLKAIAEGVGTIHPEVDSILEMGAEGSRFLHIERDRTRAGVRLIDYAINGECAAGCGSFFDQQARRLEYSVETAARVAAQARGSAPIAGRCSVFAKTDMIHAQQKGATPPEILRGLCEALVRGYQADVLQSRPLGGKAAFIGGVAFNRGVIDALQRLLDADGEKILVPESPAHYAAIGAALLGQHSGNAPTPARPAPELAWPPLSLAQVQILPPDAGSRIAASGVFLGIDIGSVSTNLVCIGSEGEIIQEIYLRTAGRPMQAVSQGLGQIREALGSTVRVRGVGTTGSGREMVGALIGADLVVNEITAHSAGSSFVAARLGRQVDTIFEIGGQDAKYIRIEDGIVVDFTMNEACSAGTGSFLEEQAERLAVNLIEEFVPMAFQAARPLRLGERCTVFMEQDLGRALRRGEEREDIVAGLAYSVAQNYLNRVVRGRPIGEVIFFQGGTAYNHAVAAAMAAILKRPIIIPPHNGVMGAYGVALMTRHQSRGEGPSAFRGFDLRADSFCRRDFTCGGCANSCTILELQLEGEKVYWGDKCAERYRKPSLRRHTPVVENLLALREDALLHSYLQDFLEAGAGELGQMARKAIELARKQRTNLRIGLPRAMQNLEYLPFWKTYLEALGAEVVLSAGTSKAVAYKGSELAVAQPCFPVQVAHGHVHSLVDAGTDWLVVPAPINAPTDAPSTPSHICPWGQTLPFAIAGSSALGRRDRLIAPVVHFRESPQRIEKDLWGTFSFLVRSRRHHRLAAALALEAQKNFAGRLLQAGQRALRALEAAGQDGIVLLGRPYNLYDPGINLNIPAQLVRHYGLNLIPLDFLTLAGEKIDELNANMFWSSGRRILQAVLYAARHRHLHLIHITNFNCGPDSFIKHSIGRGSGSPYLTLQLDGHNSDAGALTRCEAYLYSKGLLK